MNTLRITPGVDLSKIRHILFDMDGTIYRGGTLFDWTPETFAVLERLGIGFTYLTNNSSRSAADYLEKIRRLGLPGTAENIFTSSLCTLDYIKRELPRTKRIYLLGTESLAREFSAAGYTLVSERESARPDLVVAAFDTALSYDRLCKAAWWVKEGVPYIATHPDKICPTDLETVLIDCGAVTDCIAGATGRKPDVTLGKPDARMISDVMARYGLAPEETAVCGDRLYTDLAMARRAGVIGVLVLSGEATEADLAASDLTPEVVAENTLAFVRAVAAAAAY